MERHSNHYFFCSITSPNKVLGEACSTYFAVIEMNIEKHENFSDWYNEIIKEAKLCDLRYNIKGFIVIMPWAMKSIEIIYKFYDSEFEKYTHLPAFFPSLIHEKSFTAEKEHVEGFLPEVLWVTGAGNEDFGERYALKPTGEACIYPMYALWVNGLSDLPIKIYQKGWVWRHETKATKPFIRGREFLWIEAHDVFATSSEAEIQISNDAKIAKEVIWNRLGVPFIIFRRPQWDKFAGAEDTFAADTLMPDGRVLQIASTHLLGQNFSKAYGIKYINERNESVYAWQTTYGPGISRIYAATFSIHGDNKGLCLPFEIAPIQVVIIPIIKNGREEKILSVALELEKKLRKNLRVLLDLRDFTPGFKFNYWEMKGVPLRIEIGERELVDDTVTLVIRNNRKKENVKIAEIEEKIEKQSAEFTERLRINASLFFKSKLSSAKDSEELTNEIKQGKIVKVAFCTDRLDGERCAKELKEKYSCDVRGTVFSFYDSEKYELESSDIPHNEKCINCGKPAAVNVYVGRQY